MKYLTDADESIDSPQLKRNSKVLSWIESEDLLFEDTGTGLQREGECKRFTIICSYSTIIIAFIISTFPSIITNTWT